MTDIRIIMQDNGVGLVKDAELLSSALLSGNFRVEQKLFKANKFRKCLQRLAIRNSGALPLVNIFLERLHPMLFGSARLNVLVPNPDDVARMDEASKFSGSSAGNEISCVPNFFSAGL